MNNEAVIHLRLPGAKKDAWQGAALARDLDLSELIRRAVDAYLGCETAAPGKAPAVAQERHHPKPAPQSPSEPKSSLTPTNRNLCQDCSRKGTPACPQCRKNNGVA